MRSLAGVVETPIIRADGTLLDRPGYDDLTGLFYRPLGEPPKVPALPSRADAIAALARLLDAVSDFPLAGDAHRAAWLASVLTPLLRWAFAGPGPLFLFDANIRSAGKSLLAKVSALISTGRIPATMTLPSEEDERRKRITAIAMAGDLIVLLDNIEGVIGGAVINSVLTSETWADRILGLSKNTGTLPWLAVILATGNNATWALTPRVAPSRSDWRARLKGQRPAPTSRTGICDPGYGPSARELVADALRWPGPISWQGGRTSAYPQWDPSRAGPWCARSWFGLGRPIRSDRGRAGGDGRSGGRISTWVDRRSHERCCRERAIGHCARATGLRGQPRWRRAAGRARRAHPGPRRRTAGCQTTLGQASPPAGTRLWRQGHRSGG